MSSVAILSFNQSPHPVGVLNSAELSYPAVHVRQAGIVKLEFLHQGINYLAEPSVLDGYLFGVLQFVMGGAKKLQIIGPISAQAIRNANLLAEAWHTWLPEAYTPVEIIAEKVLDQSALAWQDVKPNRDRAVAAFSGGLDSTFTALRHTRPLLGNASYNIEDLVLVHGFDVSLQKQADFEELRRRIEPFVDDLGVNLRIVKTNIKDAIAHNWEHVFAAQLSCILHQFSPDFSHGLIASGAILTEPDIRWGSTPQLDYLLSGGDFNIVHDGAAFSRTEKAALIAKHHIARRSVKVCWQGEHEGRNCGRCEKCIRTRLNFLVAGVSNPECFDSPFDVEMIDQIQVNNQPQLKLLKVIVEEGKRANPDANWLVKLQRRVETLNAQLTSSAITQISPLSATTSHTPLHKHHSVSAFELKLKIQREAIAHFIGQSQPLWLLSEMPGNIGDHLIWVGTERLLTLSGLSYERVPVHSLKEETQARPGTLIIPGSGALVSLWHEWLPDLIIHSSSLFERVVILPSQFDADVPVVQNALQRHNVYPFARDVDSYKKIKKFGKAALAIDPALWAMDFTPAQPTAQHNNDTTHCKTLLALRMDQGSLLADHGFAPAAGNNDISLTCGNLDEFIHAIRSANIIITDRLHVMVAAVMLGKQIEFVDPYNHKISRYIEFNFGKGFSDQLSHKTIEWLLVNQYIKLLEVIK